MKSMAARRGLAVFVLALFAFACDTSEPEKPVYKSLREAADAADIEGARSLLAEGADTPSLKRPLSALFVAASKRDPDVVRSLLERGAEVNWRNIKGYTPLHRAAYVGDAEICQILLDAGADPNLMGTSDGHTPLAEAAKMGHLEAARVLLANGAKVDLTDSYGYTPLRRAAARDNREMAELLLTAGADVNARDDSGKTVMGAAAAERHREMVRFLASHGGEW